MRTFKAISDGDRVGIEGLIPKNIGENPLLFTWNVIVLNPFFRAYKWETNVYLVKTFLQKLIKNSNWLTSVIEKYYLIFLLNLQSWKRKVYRLEGSPVPSWKYKTVNLFSSNYLIFSKEDIEVGVKLVL